MSVNTLTTADLIGMDPAPEDATLTRADTLAPGDTIAPARGSRYKGPQFTVATVEHVRLPLGPRVNIVGTKGERLSCVPPAMAYYVLRGDDNAHLPNPVRALLAEARANRRAMIAADPRPHTGEWARFTDGTLRRISHVWEWGNGPESIQTSDEGSFYLSITHGYTQMSGGLHPGLAPDLFTLSADTKPARFWIWRDGRAKAHNGIDVYVTERVWDVATLPN